MGRSSLLRDFLSAQRNEDKILPLHSILEDIQADHQENQRQMSQEQHLPPDPSCHSRSIPNDLMPGKQYSSSVIINDDEDDRISNMSVMTTPVEQSQQQSQEKICIHDFNLIKVLGGGCMGKVNGMIMVCYR